MTNERRIKLVNELNAISKRIQAKQDEGVKKNIVKMHLKR